MTLKLFRYIILILTLLLCIFYYFDLSLFIDEMGGGPCNAGLALIPLFPLFLFYILLFLISFLSFLKYSKGIRRYRVFCIVVLILTILVALLLSAGTPFIIPLEFLSPLIIVLIIILFLSYSIKVETPSEP